MATFTDRVTVKDVRTAFTRYAQALATLGYGTDVQLQEGSQANGRAYRVVTSDQREAPGTGDRGYIGWTAREAYEALFMMARTIEFANDFMVQNPQRVMR